MNSEKYQLLKTISEGNHEQFYLDKEDEIVRCRCGHVAVWWNTNYICGTITAYPCKYNK